MAAWEDYEREVLDVFRTTGFDCSRDVVLTGVRGSHQIDVAIHAHTGGGKHLWVAECKNWKAPVKKQQLLALRSTLDDLGADHGFILCEAGFQRGALGMAASMNITLSTVAELRERFLKWQLSPSSGMSPHYVTYNQTFDDRGNFDSELLVTLRSPTGRSIADDIVEIRVSAPPLEWIIPREKALSLVQENGELKLEVPWDLRRPPNLTMGRGDPPGYWWFLDGKQQIEVDVGYEILFRTLSGPVRTRGFVPFYK